MKTCLLLVGAFFFTLVDVRAETIYSALMKNLTADEMSMLALKDSMYYHYDEWFSSSREKSIERYLL